MNRSRGPVKRRIAPPIESEEGFLRAVLDLAMTLRWRCYHARVGRTLHGWRTATQGHKGWPDLVLAQANPPSLLIVELKSRRGRMTDDQLAWAEVLRACDGIEYYQWTPADWPLIEARLKQ